MNEIAEKLDRLIDLLSRPAIPADKALWDAAAVAAYLGVSPATIQNKWSLRADFPKSIVLSDSKTKSPRRWKAGEVMAWAERQRQERSIKAHQEKGCRRRRGPFPCFSGSKPTKAFYFQGLGGRAPFGGEVQRRRPNNAWL